MTKFRLLIRLAEMDAPGPADRSTAAGLRVRTLRRALGGGDRCAGPVSRRLSQRRRLAIERAYCASISARASSPTCVTRRVSCSVIGRHLGADLLLDPRDPDFKELVRLLPAMHRNRNRSSSGVSRSAASATRRLRPEASSRLSGAASAWSGIGAGRSAPCPIPATKRNGECRGTMRMNGVNGAHVTERPRARRRSGGRDCRGVGFPRQREPQAAAAFHQSVRWSWWSAAPSAVGSTTTSGSGGRRPPRRRRSTRTAAARRRVDRQRRPRVIAGQTSASSSASSSAPCSVRCR